ncbi:MAG: isopentenyl-diphosphate Delta-isomerase [Paracoccaceae bacterium]|nr:isopentenyl-diphosphate Delta-isomerase [Paracoccaceae bacterium]
MSALIPAWMNGRLQPVDKLDVHRLALRHKAVSVFVLSGEQVLIQRRAMGKYHTPGLWANACCTHPGWGEAAEVCAARRLGEELGITGLPLVFCDRVEYRADVGGGLTEHEVVDIFRAEAPADIVPQPDPDEVMDWRWLPLRDLLMALRRRPERFTPWMQIYLDHHRASIFGEDRVATAIEPV